MARSIHGTTSGAQAYLFFVAESGRTRVVIQILQQTEMEEGEQKKAERDREDGILWGVYELVFC